MNEADKKAAGYTSKADALASLAIIASALEGEV